MAAQENKSDTERLIGELVSPFIERYPFDSMSDWFKAFNQNSRSYSRPIDRAIIGGRFSVSVGFAFAAAYQSAIEALFQPDGMYLSSFCVTEEKGNHPRALEARLVEGSGKLYISGHKTFVSGANDSERLYIACRDERKGQGIDSNGRPIIKMVSVMPNDKGVDVQAMPALGFVPEVSHGQVTLNKVSINDTQIYAGDGYLEYVKAFRSYEDVHVLAAITAYRLAEAIDQRWPKDVHEAHIALLLALRSIADMELTHAAAHIALAGCRAQLEQLITATNKHFEDGAPIAYRNWCRDQILLNIAKKAHHKRTASAWDTLHA